MSRRKLCPTCQKPTVWKDNPSRPFCSERCKLIDLGRWVSGDYRIPVVEEKSTLPEEEKKEDLT